MFYFIDFLSVINIISIRKACSHPNINIHTFKWNVCIPSLDYVLISNKQCTLQWRHNERDSVSNHRCLYSLLNRLFRYRTKKTSNLRVTSHCEGNSLMTSEFPAQRTSNAGNVSLNDDVMKQIMLLVGQYTARTELPVVVNQMSSAMPKLKCKLAIIFKNAYLFTMYCIPCYVKSMVLYWHVHYLSF